jgi:tetratricopeptide (TPR) repeat protein
MRIAWIHIKQKGVVTVCQGQRQILNASEQVLNTDTSRRCQLFSVVRTLLCACVVALMPYGSVFAQAPAMERSEYDAQIGPDRPGARYPHLGDDEVRVEPPRSVGNRLPASKTVTRHELSHHVPGRAVEEYKRALKATNEGEKENAIAHYQKACRSRIPRRNQQPRCYLSRLEQADVAIEQFTKAIAMDPHAARPQVNLAIACLRKGLFADAERAARRALSEAPAPTVCGKPPSVEPCRSAADNGGLD